MVSRWGNNGIWLRWIWALGLLMIGPVLATAAPALMTSQPDPQSAPSVTPARLSLSTGKLVFDTVVGSAQILTQDISVTASGSGSADNYSAFIQTKSKWLSVGDAFSGSGNTSSSSVSAPAPGVLRVSVNVYGLKPGIYRNNILLSISGMATGPELLPIILNLRNPPTLMSRPTTLSFSHQSDNNYNLPPPQSLAVYGDATRFNISISTSPGGGWLYVTPAVSSTPSDLSVSVNASGLAPGVYQGTINISVPGATTNALKIPVVLNVTAPAGIMVLPDSISLQAQYGSHKPVSQGLLAFTNGGVLPVSASTTGESWLSVLMGYSWAGGVDGETGMVLPLPADMRVYADPTGLPVGTYTGYVTIYGEAPVGITLQVTLQISPNDLILPRVVDGAGWNTEITLINTDAEPAPFTLRLWNPDGTPLVLAIDGVGSVSEYSDTIPVGATRTIRTSGPDSILSQGWADITAQRSIGGTATFRQIPTQGDKEVSFSLAPAPADRILLPFDNISGYESDLSLINSGSGPATVALNFYDENGYQVAVDSIVLAPQNQQSFSVQDRYPQLANLRGTAELVHWNGAISATSLRVSPAGSFVSFQYKNPEPTSANASIWTIPQVVDGNGWKTTFVLVNPGPVPAPFSVAFRDSTSGTPLDVPLFGIGELPEYSDVIPAGAVRIVETQGQSISLTQGWGEIVSSSPITGTVVYSQTDANGSVSEASMELSSPGADSFVLPFDNAGGLTTALGLLNQSSADMVTRVNLRGEDGRLLASRDLALSAESCQTFFLSSLFPGADGIGGSIEFFGARLTAIGLRFSPSGSFASLPSLKK